MTYDLINRLFEHSVEAALAIWAFLLVRLFYGILKRNSNIIKRSAKHIVNTVSFLFVYAVYFSFSIVVRAPHGKNRDESLQMLNDWVRQETFEWSIWAILLTVLLVLFNAVYQAKIEKVKDNKQLIWITTANVLVMSFGIFLGAMNALSGLTEEIDRNHTSARIVLADCKLFFPT
jgi:hypothetical protein